MGEWIELLETGIYHRGEKGPAYTHENVTTR